MDYSTCEYLQNGEIKIFNKNFRNFFNFFYKTGFLGPKKTLYNFLFLLTHSK